MEKIYYDVEHPAAFGGVKGLQRAARTTKVHDFLQRSNVYTQYKPIRRHFPRRKTIAHSKFELLQGDLADFQKYARYNAGFRYVLVVVDVLSKFTFLIPLKNKKSDEVQRAFKQVFKVAHPKLLQTDQGTEFTSKVMQDFFKKYNVHWYHTFSESKATLAERMIRTLREKLARIFHHTGRFKYVHLLKTLAAAYNRRKHSRTGLAPIEVDASNEMDVFQRLYGGPRRTSSKPRFAIGDQVRIAKMKGIFAKGAAERRWTEEIFTVKRVKPSDPIMYYIQDLNGEEILGGFYGDELNRVKTPDLWDIEKIIKRKRDKDGKMHYYVKWRGYGNEHNSWVTDIHRK